MKKQYICIGCPLGCVLEVEIEGKEVLSVSGNQCPVGEKWIREEIKAPKRTLLTVLPVKNGKFDTVSVKSSKPVPKDRIPELLQILARVEVEAPVHVGDVILHNPLGLNVDIVATREA
ncbi:MAG: DUF1667 domain-containing protein [Euryarchaeota archaeon]|nr:DUF1667 domain-containing protein [Euryarchaeota archaeon]